MKRDDATMDVPVAPASAGRRAAIGTRSRRALATVAALAAVSITAVAATAGSSASAHTTAHAAALTGLYGSLPPTGTPTKGGTISLGQTAGSTPTYIFPILPSAQASVYTSQQFFYNFFTPLYSGPVGNTPEVNYAVSAASGPPTFSDGNKTVTMHLKTNLTWSDGQPVDANDVMFDIDMLEQAVKESAANWSAYTPGFFPDSLKSASTSGKYTVILHLKRAYNPGFFLNDQLEGALWPLPSTAWNIDKAGGAHLDFTVPANAKKIYDYLSKQGGNVATFGSNPLWKDVDGPFVLTSFSPTNSSYTLSANKHYTGSPKPYISALNVETFTGITPLVNALRTGALDIGGIDFSQLGLVAGLRSSGYSVYGYPDLGFFSAFINFKDKTDHFNSIIGQLYARQVLAYLEDQPAYLTGIFKNAGVLAYGPVPSVPPTPYTPADAVKTPYPYNPASAVALLKAHGWKVVPNGQTTCAKPGSGAGECGPGIPAGTPFKFTWFYIPATESPSSGLESEAFASVAKQSAGIDVELQSKTFNYLIANFNDADPADAKYDNDWGIDNFGGFTDDYYPTTNSIFNTGGDYNAGAYSDPTADKLINDSVYGTNPKAVTNEASYLTKDIPALFTPNTDYIIAVSKKVGGTADSWLALTQETTFPQYWYLNK